MKTKKEELDNWCVYIPSLCKCKKTGEKQGQIKEKKITLKKLNDTISFMKEHLKACELKNQDDAEVFIDCLEGWKEEIEKELKENE